jgi:hypothetical protein
MMGAVLFLYWSYLLGITAGLFTNVIFFALHVNNHRKVVQSGQLTS